VSTPVLAAPRERFSYSSYGYVLIGAALETATSTSYESIISKYVLEPAGMAATQPATKPASGSASFYEITDAGQARPAPPIDLSDRLPAGGYLSTAADLARFGAALAGGRLVGAKGQALLFTPQRTRGSRSTEYGLGFEVRASPLGRFVGHTGSVAGGTTALLIHPRSRATLALTTNLGYVTAASPPPPAQGTPEPPMLLLPFIRQ